MAPEKLISFIMSQVHLSLFSATFNTKDKHKIALNHVLKAYLKP